MTATTTTPTVSRARRIAFGVTGVLLAALGVVVFGVFSAVPLVTEWGGMHWFHELAFVCFGVLYLGGLLAHLQGGTTRRPAALLAVVAFPFLVGAGGMATGFMVPPLIVMFVLAIAFAVLHPGDVLDRRPGSPSAPLLGLAAVALVPALFTATDEFALQAAAAAGDEHAEFGHWITIAAFAVALPLLTAAAGLRLRGARFLGSVTGAVAVVAGLGAVAFPDLPSTFGVGWGLVVAAWGVAVIAATNVTVEETTSQEVGP